MFSRCVKDEITRQRLTIEIHLADALAYSVRILDSNLIDSTTDTASHDVFLPLRADARIDLETIVGRLDTEYELSDGVPVPGSGSCEPAVLGFTRLGRILTGNHL